VAVTTRAIRCAKIKSNHHPQLTNTQLFTGQMPFLSPNQQCQSTEGKRLTFHRLALQSSPYLTQVVDNIIKTNNKALQAEPSHAVNKHVMTHQIKLTKCPNEAAVAAEAVVGDRKRK